MADLKITARELIRKAFRVSGILGTGESPSDEEAEDALFTLNEIVDSWNLENMMFSCTKETEINCDGSLSYETIKFNNGIDNVFYETADRNVRQLSQSTREEFELSKINYASNGDPSCFYYNGTFPYSLITVYPTPSFGKLKIISSGQFELFDTLDSMVYLGSGYTRALQYNLAVMLAAEYGRDIPDTILTKAVSDKALIKISASNQIEEHIYNDFPGCTRKVIRYNIRNGD